MKVDMTKPFPEVAIIGAGPAGIAANLQLVRYGVRPLLFEKDRPGGLLKNAHRVENYPGFPGGISGPRLVALLGEHLEAAGVEVRRECVERLEYRETVGDFLLTTGAGEYVCSRVIVAAGTQPRRLDWVENLPDQLKEFVHYEVFPLVGEKGKDFFIIGAGDAAFDYALNLAESNHVTVANRGDRVKALPLLLERAQRHSRIVYREHTELHAVSAGEGKNLCLELSVSGGKQKVMVDHVLCAVGRVPLKDFYTPALTEQAQELKEKGILFEIGDMVNGLFRQTAIACGDGIRAAMEIEKLIQEDMNDMGKDTES